MPTLGTDSIRVREGSTYVGNCLLCPQPIILYDHVYEVLVNESNLFLAHDFCFFHLWATAAQHFENNGMPNLEPTERVM